jgi:hypothetical protein
VISRVHVYEMGRELWKTLFIELMMWYIRVGTTRLRSVLLQGVRKKLLSTWLEQLTSITTLSVQLTSHGAARKVWVNLLLPDMLKIGIN